MSPKRTKSRSKTASRVEAITAAVADLTPKCIATIVEMANGPLILMACPAAAHCPRCSEARRQQRPLDIPPTPSATPKTDVETSSEEN